MSRTECMKWPVKTFIILTAIIMVFVFFSAFTQTAKAEDKAVIGTAVCIARKTLNLRSGPSTSYSKVAKIARGTAVDVYSQSGKWYEINYNGLDCWAYGAYLSFTPAVLAEVPAPELTAGDTVQTVDRTFTFYYQGDKKWKFRRSVAKKACLMTAFSITINNMGIPATPATLFQSNGKTTNINLANLAANFGVQPVSALNADSAYLQGFDGYRTYIIDPQNNAIAAIKEALDRHPEGVILSFQKGSRAHSVVACSYEGDTIYFSDPGRNKGKLLDFNTTWTYYHHKMTYKHLQNIIALDPVM